MLSSPRCLEALPPRSISTATQRRGYSRKPARAERSCPVWNRNFPSARKLSELDQGNAAVGTASQIDQRPAGLERPRDDFIRRLHVIGKPERRSGSGRCLLPDFLCEDRCAMSTLGESDAAGETGDACAYDCYLMLHPNIYVQ